jgi:hypothetical protein
MRRFVFWTGVISVAAGVGLQSPALAAALIPSAEPGWLIHVFGVMAVFIGVMLALCSRDLRARGSLVVWEGILRLSGFAIMGYYGLFGHAGVRVATAGLFDLIVGATYLVWLPRHLQASFVDLLLDRQGRR